MPEAYRSKVTVARKPPCRNRQKVPFRAGFGDSQGACLRGIGAHHFLADPTLPYGRVIDDYLKEA
jgi:hypothetical protein